MAAEPIVPDPRLRNLDNPAIVGFVYLLSMLVLGFGETAIPAKYGEPGFVTAYLRYEILVACLFVAATFMWFPARRIGLGAPRMRSMKLAMPMFLWFGLAVAAYAITWFARLPGSPHDFGLSARMLATTSLVGFAEEWMYRGLLFAFLSRVLGLRAGGYLALLAFGVLHLLNMIGGVPPAGAAMQFGITACIGSVLLLGALGTGSLWVGMLLHALYDFIVFDMMTIKTAGLRPGFDWVGLLPLVGGLVLGVYALTLVGKLKGVEPYPEE